MLNKLEKPSTLSASFLSASRSLDLRSYAENMYQLKSNPVKTHQEIHSMDGWLAVHAPRAQITKKYAAL